MSISKRSLCTWLVLLAAFGTWGYARHNPAFAERCRTFHTTYVKPVCDAGKALLQRQTTAAKKELARTSGSSRFDRREQTGNNTRPTAQSARENLSPGGQIANGHAFGKHKHEFGFASRAEMATHIDQVINSTRSSNVRYLQGGRVAYWDDTTASVVIVDPNTTDGGTAFKPGRGRAYFTNLR